MAIKKVIGSTPGRSKFISTGKELPENYSGQEIAYSWLAGQIQETYPEDIGGSIQEIYDDITSSKDLHFRDTYGLVQSARSHGYIKSIRGKK